MQQYGYNNYGGRGFNSSSAWNGNYSRNYDDWNDNYAGEKGKGKGGKGFQFHSSPTYSQASLYQQQRGLLEEIGDYSACTTCNAPDHFSSQCTIAYSLEFWQVCTHTITKVKTAIEYERHNPSPIPGPVLEQLTAPTPGVLHALHRASALTEQLNEEVLDLALEPLQVLYPQTHIPPAGTSNRLGRLGLQRRVEAAHPGGVVERWLTLRNPSTAEGHWYLHQLLFQPRAAPEHRWQNPYHTHPER